MPDRIPVHRWKPGWTLRALPLLLPMLALAGCASNDSSKYPQSALIPLADFAQILDDVFRTTVFWAAIVFVLVEAALLYCVFRFRGRPDDPEPKQVHGNTTAEIIWTAIPALILAMIAVPTVKAIFRTYEKPSGADVVQIEVIGHQWWWEFKYPQYGVTTANELHVPAGKTVFLSMKTQDVLHSFWLPQFAGKRDVFNNRSTTLWFKTDSVGYYSGQCTEFCGIQHGRMGFHVQTHAFADFEARMNSLKLAAAPAAPAAPAADSAAAPAPSASAGTTTATLGATVADTGSADSAQAQAAPAVDPLVAQGQQLFLAKGCIGCHSMDGAKPMGIGPNLAGIGTRRYIAAGQFKNTDENLAKWIMNAQAMKEGVLMPNLGVKDDEAKALVAYLRTHR